MVPKTMHELLLIIEKFHIDLAIHLGNSAELGASEREQLLLKYLAIHEQKQAIALAELHRHEAPGTLNTWFYTYTDRHPIIVRNPYETDFKSLNCDEISAIMCDTHNQLMDLYEHLHYRAECGSSRNMLEQLLIIEVNDARQIARDSARAQEM